MPNQSFKLQTIKKSSDFNEVFKKYDTKAITSNITVLALKNRNCDRLTIGYVASKKSGGAVHRNFIKRRARAIMKNCIFEGIAMKNLLLIFIPRYSFHKEDFSVLIQEAQYLLSKINSFYNKQSMDGIK